MKTNKHRNTKPDKDEIPKSILVAGALVVLFILGWIFGLVPYAVKYIECGRPPTSIEPPGFMSGSSVGMPQDPSDHGYGPGFGKTYTCYSKDELYPDNTPIHKTY